MLRRLGFFTFVCLVMIAARVSAQPLRVDRSDERMRVDGALREWKGAHFVTLGSGGDAALRYALASTGEGFYLGAEISDEALVRHKGVGPGQDALVFGLAMQDAQRKLRVTEFWLHAGEPSRSQAQAGYAEAGKPPLPEPRIQVVEGPRSEGAGYVIEAFIPFALVEGSELWEQGRAHLRLEDVDRAQKPSLETTLATSDVTRPSDWPRIALGTGQVDHLASFAQSKGLSGTEPRFDLRGNVAGDATPERVVILDKFVLVYGKQYQRGETYAYFALPFSTGGGLVSAQLEDATGDGHEDLFVRVRQRNDLGARELLLVLSLAENSIAPLFSVELKKEAKGGFVESQLDIEKPSHGGRRIRVATGRAQGLDALTYQENPAVDAEPILLPWGDTKSRTYAFNGSRFAVVDEQKRPVAKLAAVVSTSNIALGPASASPLPVAAAPSQEARPDLNAVLAQFKRDQKLPPGAQPERQLRANIWVGPAEEQLSAFGATLVLAGPDIAGGTGYLAYKLPITDLADLLYLGAADVTGDGLREPFVRIKQPLSGAAGVYREVLLVLRADAHNRFVRILVAEVARRQGERAIVNRVRHERGKLLIEPGEAQGFSQATYPFRNEATGGVERLLLPWLDRPLRYRLEGERLVAE
jgi:hypothetical protein